MKRFITLVGILWGLTSLWAQDYADNSVLSTGKWTKMGIIEPGVYRLDFDALASAGFEPSSIDPRNIHIYGNGGGMLPQSNEVERPDDLLENAIEVVGEADGSFDQGDFILFYAEGSDKYVWNVESQLLGNEQNLYADTNYYFITVNSEPGKRISSVPNLPSSTFSASSLRGTAFHEVDLYNPIESGRFWLGESFSSAQSLQTFSLPTPDVPADRSVRVTFKVAAASSRPSQFTLQIDGIDPIDVLIGEVTIGAETGNNYRFVSQTVSVPGSAMAGKDSIDITLQYTSTDFGATGWLDYIDIDYDQAPSLNPNVGRMMMLVDNTGPGEVAEIQLKNGDAGYRIWNISDKADIVSQEFEVNGSNLNLNLDASDLKMLYAFKGGTQTPVSFASVANQTLHSLNPVD